MRHIIPTAGIVSPIPTPTDTCHPRAVFGVPISCSLALDLVFTTHTHTHAHNYACMPTNTHTCTHAHTHGYTHAHTHTHTHITNSVHMHTHVCPHTHSYTGDGLITVNDLDPLGLHLPIHSRHSGMSRNLGFKVAGHDNIIQVAFIAETAR